MCCFVFCRFDIMSRVPMGKVLLRNVIRHTDAHNKVNFCLSFYDFLSFKIIWSVLLICLFRFKKNQRCGNWGILNDKLHRLISQSTGDCMSCCGKPIVYFLLRIFILFHAKFPLRGQMHCDRDLDSEGSMRDRLGDRLSERDEKEARYWTRKLYEFEANDPDRYSFICI